MVKGKGEGKYTEGKVAGKVKRRGMGKRQAGKGTRGRGRQARQAGTRKEG